MHFRMPSTYTSASWSVDFGDETASFVAGTLLHVVMFDGDDVGVSEVRATPTNIARR